MPRNGLGVPMGIESIFMTQEEKSHERLKTPFIGPIRTIGRNGILREAEKKGIEIIFRLPLKESCRLAD